MPTPGIDSLRDKRPHDRAIRVLLLLNSNIAEERERGARELLASVPWAEFKDFVEEAVARTPPGPQPEGDPPDTGWRVVDLCLGIAAARCLGGHSLTVYEDAVTRGRFYPHVDGFQLETYPCIGAAAAAADAAVAQGVFEAADCEFDSPFDVDLELDRLCEEDAGPDNVDLELDRLCEEEA